MNLLLLCVMLVLASPQISFADFGSDVAMNVGNFAHWIVGLGQQFSRGASR
jgi:hypothetical protein